jgi:HAE1 family hydrophobic/amphiphilic exporter-1
VQENIFIGGALTMIVLMAFLHLGVRTLIVIPLIMATALGAVYVSPWLFAVCLAIVVGAGFWFARGALVVGLAIPTSIIGTFLILGMLGRSLNVISLAGLAFAVGMLVDNAIVVLENIYRRYAMGESPFTAAARATQEVWGAVVASTLTTVAVFVPVVFVQEEAGQLFQDIALAISAAVGLSLVVSVTLIPMASARLFGNRRNDELDEPDDSESTDFEKTAAEPHGNGRPAHSVLQVAGSNAGRNKPRGARAAERISRAAVAPISGFGSLFIGLVTGINAWVLKGTIRRVAMVVALVTASVGLSWALWPKVEYLPTGNRNLVFGILIPPPGYNIDQLTQMGEQVEAALRPYWDVDLKDSSVFQKKYPPIADFFFVVRGRSVFLGLRSADPTRVGDLVGLVREVAGGLPGTFVVAKQSSLFEQGLTAGRTVDVEITGPDLVRLVQLGGQVFGSVRQEMPAAQAIPKPSLDLSSPEVHVDPKLLQAAEMGVRTSDLGYMVNALVDGAYAGDYYLGASKIDLTIMGEEHFARQTQDVESLPVATPSGQLVPLGALADVDISSGPEQVNHRERLRAITIEVHPPPEMALEDAMGVIQEKIVGPMRAGGQLDGGYMITLAGTADKLRDTWKALQFNVILALLITYLLMAALFESWLYPLVIILTVPLGAVGGVLGLQLLNLFYLQPLDVLTMLGFVILIGTVVNNPILIVHQSLNHMREDGMSPRAAILESVRTRIRPIFMTTITTILGLLPLVLFPGAGSELYRGLGSVVLGGLLVSTIFTLFLVPTMFSLTMDAKGIVLRLLKRQPPASRPTPHEVEQPVAASH